MDLAIIFLFIYLLAILLIQRKQKLIEKIAYAFAGVCMVIWGNAGYAREAMYILCLLYGLASAVALIELVGAGNGRGTVVLTGQYYTERELRELEEQEKALSKWMEEERNRKTKREEKKGRRWKAHKKGEL